MKNKYSITGILLALLGIGWFLLALDYYETDDGVNLELASTFAKVSSLVGDKVYVEPSFKPASAFDLTEEKAITILGAYSVLLGLISVAMSFLAIKTKEHPGLSLGAFGLGLGPVILFNIYISIGLFLLMFPLLYFYSKRIHKAHH
ncbi:hypothetical protein QWY82_10485 [Simiduia curdlanivorans]|uniref:DUF4064 domain-containing protein n=1 Tax=Simiduia curdlanivorans TaxID=1492769 RepID=A0ABV8UZE3_9GAMM|nr:hypothetical protein [Simiduia curdlanivorans]MDN3639237.1 hypothetical protein [Simiduia curdlanivorans]